MNLTYSEDRFLDACYQENFKQILHLLPQIDSVNFEDENGKHPLMYAIQNDNQEQTQLLLDNGALINWINNAGDNVLSNINSTEMLTFLIEKGLDIHYQEDKTESPLSYIIYHGNIDVAKGLINLGVKYQHLDLESLREYRKDSMKEYIEAIEAKKESERFDLEVLKKSEKLSPLKLKL